MNNNLVLGAVAVVAIIVVAALSVGFLPIITGSESGPGGQDNDPIVQANGEGGLQDNGGNGMQGDGSGSQDNGSTGNGVMLDEAEYVPFEKAKYDKARAEGKVIWLEFYANWCPVCREQAPHLEQAFAEVDNTDVVGFRVNYNDSETDADEQAIAREFGVTYQHTHIILRPDGSVATKSLELWQKDRILEEIGKVV